MQHPSDHSPNIERQSNSWRRFVLIDGHPYSAISKKLAIFSIGCCGLLVAAFVPDLAGAESSEPGHAVMPSVLKQQNQAAPDSNAAIAPTPQQQESEEGDQEKSQPKDQEKKPADALVPGDKASTVPDPTVQDPQPGSAVDLPWERKRENRIPRLTELTARELLGDVTEEQVLSIRDHIALNQIDQQLFARLLFRIPQFGLDNLLRLSAANADVELAELARNSGFHRLKILKVEGRARQWERRRLVDEVGELFDLSIYYKVKIVTEDQQNVIVYCHSIPDAWKETPDINEQVSFEGLYVNFTLSQEMESILNFIADRVRWMPSRRSELVTRQGPALLGSAGFDLGLLDTLPERNRKQFDDEDTETFFQLLAAVEVIANSRNAPDWADEVPAFDLIEVLRSPEKYHGDLSIIPVQIRNITRVKVEQAYIRERIGVDEYWQLDGFVKFDSSVTYKDEDGKPGAVFKEKYPVSLCVHRLPAGWKAGSGQHYTATFPAFFYRLWAYPSGYQSQFSEEALQQSPVLFALDPVRVEASPSQVNWTAIILVSILGVGLITLWTSYYVGRARKDRPASRFQLPNRLDADEIPQVSDTRQDSSPVPGMPVVDVDRRDP